MTQQFCIRQFLPQCILQFTRSQYEQLFYLLFHSSPTLVFLLLCTTQTQKMKIFEWETELS